MNKNDKDKIMILVFLVAFILISVCMIKGTKIIPFRYLLLAVLLIQYIYVVPTICKNYYTVKGATAKWDRFIPFWNEVTIFSPKLAILTLISYLLIIIGLLCLFIPTETINNIFGEAFMYNYGDWIIRYLALTLIASDIVTAIGYYKVMRDVSFMHQQLIGKAKVMKLEVLYYVLLFIPMIRLVSLSFILDRLNKLNRLNKYNPANKHDKLEEV